MVFYREPWVAEFYRVGSLSFRRRSYRLILKDFDFCCVRFGGKFVDIDYLIRSGYDVRFVPACSVPDRNRG